MVFSSLVFGYMTFFWSEWGIESPTINVWGLVFDLSFSNVSFTNRGALVFGGIYVKNWTIILVYFFFDEYEVSFPYIFDQFRFEVYFVKH